MCLVLWLEFCVLLLMLVIFCSCIRLDRLVFWFCCSCMLFLVFLG